MSNQSTCERLAACSRAHTSSPGANRHDIKIVTCFTIFLCQLSSHEQSQGELSRIS